MNKLIYSVAYTLSLIVYASCSTDLNNSYDNKIVRDQLPEEVASPSKSKEKITMSNGVVIEKLDSCYILGGDMLLTQEQVNKMSNCTKASMVTNFVKHWPSGKIYYEFSTNVDESMRLSVLNGMNMWANNTGLEFIESNIGNRLFIIQTTDSNSSYVGC